jgi:HAD superfamily hydrolase (TIGR01509 family)
MSSKITIANRLFVPAVTQAILWDMDGVLIDSLRLDLTLCNQLLQRYIDASIVLTPDFIRSLFAYDPTTFWQLILDFVEKEYAIADTQAVFEPILQAFNQARQESHFSLNPGIIEILQAARQQPLKMAVVSNNPTAEVERMLAHAKILDYFDQVVGNDIQRTAKKPAPDTYLLAARLLAVEPQHCVVIEDSLVGAEAGQRAGCYTIGVATGGADFADLAQVTDTQATYTAFQPVQLKLQLGNVKQKHLVTPNEFVSHMIEHIAWRLGTEITLTWYHDDWWQLGQWLGEKIKALATPRHATSVALGMIDDGSAEVCIDTTRPPILDLKAISTVDLNWFLALRCEQLTSGQPLVTLMQGLTQGLQAYLQVRVCSVEDPHHTWEGIFRALGIALSKLLWPKPTHIFDGAIEKLVSSSELRVIARSVNYCQVFRGTAESHVVVTVDFTRQLPFHFAFKVAPSINVSELPLLLEPLAKAAGFTLQVEFQAAVLSSSHVVLEDTALVLGRALLEILTLRMLQTGVNGAGSSLETLADQKNQAIRVGLSVEGRKFWHWVPFQVSLDTLKKEFILGHTVYQHLRAEDLDDFLDGLAGGLACSIILHVAELIAPEQGWPLIFLNLGKALQEVFASNPYRQGVPPGVKATLS